MSRQVDPELAAFVLRVTAEYREREAQTEALRAAEEIARRARLARYLYVKDLFDRLNPLDVRPPAPHGFPAPNWAQEAFEQ
jgi:hypothetical protein